MKKNIYFAGSIRGGQADTALYHKIIEYIKQTDTVLTEQVGDIRHSALEGSYSEDRVIYLQDTEWLQQCDTVIAECTVPSLGVGYELAYAEAHGKPVHILYRPDITNLSAMIKGNEYFTVHPYQTEQDAYRIIDFILHSI